MTENSGDVPRIVHATMMRALQRDFEPAQRRRHAALAGQSVRHRIERLGVQMAIAKRVFHAFSQRILSISMISLAYNCCGGPSQHVASTSITRAIENIMINKER